MRRPPAYKAQAADSLTFMELRAICASCVNRLLAANSNCGADLRAPVEVRMVWWGFRALKTPERA